MLSRSQPLNSKISAKLEAGSKEERASMTEHNIISQYIGGILDDLLDDSEKRKIKFQTRLEWKIREVSSGDFVDQGVAGVVRPTKGEVLVDGIDRDANTERFRSMIGYLPQDVNFYDDFTGIEYLQYVAALKGLPDRQAGEKIAELADKVGLTADLSRKCVKYSGGMKRRLGIAQLESIKLSGRW